MLVFLIALFSNTLIIKYNPNFVIVEPSELRKIPVECCGMCVKRQVTIGTVVML